MLVSVDKKMMKKNWLGIKIGINSRICFQLALGNWRLEKS